MKVKVNVTTRHLDDRNRANQLRKYAMKKLPRVERYMNVDYEPSDIKLILETENFRNIAEIIVNDGNFKTTATVIDEDHFSSIDKVVDIVIKQLRRNQDKVTSGKRRSLRNQKIKNRSEQERQDFSKITVKKLPLKPMSITEARLQLDIVSNNFVAFRNSEENGTVNVLYKDKKSEIFLLKP